MSPGSFDSHHDVVTRKMYSNGFRTMLRDKCLIQLSKTYSAFAHKAGAVKSQQKIRLMKKKIDCFFLKSNLSPEEMFVVLLNASKS